MADNTIDVAVRIGGDASGGEKAVKSIRQELKEATQQAVELSRKFGDTSAEAVAAQKKVALLKDEMGDLKARVDALNPDAKFRAFSQSIQGVVGGFAGLQGAIGLFGTESAELERQLLKVQSALALSEGLNSVLEAKDSFKSLKVVALDAFNSIRAAIGSTGIGLFVVALGTIVVYWDEIKKAVTGATEETEAYALAQKEVNSEIQKAEENLLMVNSAFKAVKDGTMSGDAALKLYNEKLGAVLGKTDSLSVAEERYSKFSKLYIESIKARATAQVLFAKSAEAAAKAATGEDADLSWWDKAVVAVNTAVGNVGVAQAQLAARSAQNVADNQKTIKFYQDLGAKELAKATEIETQINAAGVNARYDATAKASKAVVGERQREFTEIQRISNDTLTAQQITDEQFLANKANTNNLLIGFDTALTESEKANAEARTEIAKTEAQAKMDALKQWGIMLGDISGLVGESTAAGKAAAIASTTISTYNAAQDAYKSQMAIASPDAPVRAAIAYGIAVAKGIANVKKILSVKVPGGKGGGGAAVPAGAGGANARPPMTAQPNIQQTQLTGQNNVGVNNQQAFKAFVVEKDITDSQDRIAKIKAAATI